VGAIKKYSSISQNADFRKPEGKDSINGKQNENFNLAGIPHLLK